MTAGDGETATVFLETSVGTRLVVSFPARATTVADLKRLVSAEHAACFPRSGPIAVTSFQVKLDGSWFRLTDSMAVQAAFEWVKGPWRLLVEAHELRSHPLARKDAKCGTGDAEPNVDHPVVAEDFSQYMLPPAASQGDGNVASGDGDSDTPQVNHQDKAPGDVKLEHSSGQRKGEDIMPRESSDIDIAAGDGVTTLPNQEDKPHKGVEHASGQCEGGNTMPLESSNLDLEVDDSDTPPMKQQDKPHNGVEHALGQREDGSTMPQESPDLDLAAGGSNILLPNQEDKRHECVKHASDPLEDGNTMPEQSSDLDLAEDGSDTPHEGVERASSQREDGYTSPQESSDLDLAADKDNGPDGGQQNDIIVEPRGKKRFREEGKNDDGSLPSLARSTHNVQLSEKKGSVTEQAGLNSDPLPYDLGDPSNGSEKEPSCGQKKPWTSVVCNGESCNDGSDIPPYVEPMERDNSSDKEVKAHRGDEEEPWIAGLYAGKSSCKGTDTPHCVESMKKYTNGHYLRKGRYEGATSTVNTEHEACFQRRQQRVVVRKVPMSKAMKIYAFRCYTHLDDFARACR